MSVPSVENWQRLNTVSFYNCSHDFMTCNIVLQLLTTQDTMRTEITSDSVKIKIRPII